MATPATGQVIHRAYELWERAGKPDGRDQEFYYQAERQLAGEEGQKSLPNKPD
jgi:hypothetical protein